jgi:uncharacterized RDD family membrane protein YckC
MMYDLQKASLLKRASAFLLDFILLVVLATGVGMVVSAITGFDTYNDTLGQRQAQYEQQYGVSFDLSQSEFAELTEEEQKKLTDAYDELAKDPDFIYNYNMVINLSLTIVSTSLLVAYLTLEFVVPLLFGNGQTVGKKIFGIAVMKLSGIKVDAVSLFVRTLLGKFTFETMIPLLLLLMMLWGAIGMVGPLVIGAILVTEIVFMITSHTNAMIHDKLAQTVAVDMQSQMIFASEAELLAYKAKAHEEMVKKQSY